MPEIPPDGEPTRAELKEELRRAPSQGMWQIVKGLEEMGVVEKGCGGCPDSRIYEAVQELKDRADKSEENYQFMVKKAVDNHLPAYREMGDKLFAMDTEARRLRAVLDGIAASPCSRAYRPDGRHQCEVDDLGLGLCLSCLARKELGKSDA